MYEIAKNHDAPVIPIEDLKPGDKLNNQQIVPSDEINVDRAFELAYAGLSNRAIGAKMGINHVTVNTHFEKTMARARAEAALDSLLYIQDVAAGNIEKPSKMRYDAHMFLLTQRYDPMPKEQPQIVIAQNFSTQQPLFNVSLDELNDA